MGAARNLLDLTGRSALAGVLHSGLVGLRAALQEAVERTPGDPGAPACREVLAELSQLLTPAPGESGPAPGEPADTRPPPAGAGRSDQLRALAAEFAADPQVRTFLGSRSLATLRHGEASTPAEVLWRTLHLRLLRLPRPVAAGWHLRAGALVEVDPDRARWMTLPADEATVLIPPFTADDQGLRAGPDGVVAADIAAALRLSGSRPEVAALARLATATLALGALDDQLHLSLESLQFHGSRRLDGAGLRQYRDELVARLADVAGSPAGSPGELESLIEADEALASLVHRPPAAPHSWWAALTTASRRILTARAAALRADGGDIEIQPLVLRYRDLHGMTGGNDVPVDTGGQAGDVLACLRVWARIGNRDLPGRVLYRM